MKRIFLFTLAVFLFVGVPVTSTTAQKSVSKSLVKAERKIELAKSVKAELDSRYYVIVATEAQPKGGAAIRLSGEYDLRVTIDSVYCYLPYYGRKYNSAYVSSEGLIFDYPITDYKVTQGKRDVTYISFKTQTQQDTYVFKITVFSNGFTNIYVLPSNKEGVNFLGELRIKNSNI